MAWACKVKNFVTAVRARKVRPDVMVPNSKVTQIVDIFWLVCQTVQDQRLKERSAKFEVMLHRVKRAICYGIGKVQLEISEQYKFLSWVDNRNSIASLPVPPKSAQLISFGSLGYCGRVE